MANKDAAFGLRAIGKVGQNRDNQGLSEYDIASDDPYERFEVQSDGATAAADVGLNADIVYAAGSSPDYVSKVELDFSDQKTATAQLRILAISNDIENNTAGSANVNLVVMINEHFLKGTVGI